MPDMVIALIMLVLGYALGYNLHRLAEENRNSQQS
jgi:hypothetical protein